MYLPLILFSALLMFVVIFLAVRLAIKPLLIRPKEIWDEQEDFGLVKLRDIGVVNNTELEEIIALYHKKTIHMDKEKAFRKYADVLNALKEADYFSEEEYLHRMNILKDHFLGH